jgi:hypothetical protein
MQDTDWDDDANVERWCAEQRRVATEYMKSQPVRFGELGEWPAWYVAPYVSVWAIESVIARGRVGWWVICGDLPTDYASGGGTPDPRSAVAEFAERWNQVASAMERGEKHASFSVGASEDAVELAPLLKSRAELLSRWVRDDSMWDE